MAESTMGQHSHHTYTELRAIAQHFKRKPGEAMIGWVLRVYDQGGMALVLSFQELALLGDLTDDIVFNGLCRNRQWISPTPLLAWLLKAWRQRWPSFPPSEVIFRPWVTEEQSAQVVRQLGMLQWIYHEPAFEKAPCPAPEDMPFTNDMRQRLLALATFPHMKLPLASLPDNDTPVLRVLMEMEMGKRAAWGPPGF